MADIDAIAYYEKPLRRFERIVSYALTLFPRALPMFADALFAWLGEKLLVEHTIQTNLSFNGKVYFVPHHASHAAAAYYTSPFTSAAILTADGVGEYTTTELWHGTGSRIEPLALLEFPHSLGLLYSVFTGFLGFRVNDDEYKLMGLAGYGSPLYLNQVRSLVCTKEDGSFELAMKYFRFHSNARSWSKQFETLFGEPRKPHEAIQKRHHDIAASIQAFTEEIYMSLAQEALRRTGETALCVGGGCALNAAANGVLLRSQGIQQISIFGPAGDAGAAMGAALYVEQVTNNGARYPVDDLRLGKHYGQADIEAALTARADIRYEKYTQSTLEDRVATLLAQGKSVAWFQGRAEFGPRALGARSILMHPSYPDAKKHLNEIKGREMFRPFGIAILEDTVPQYLEAPEHTRVPHMNFCFKVKESASQTIIEAVHVNGTVRAQSVVRGEGGLGPLLEKFERATSIPALINTSLNAAGEPLIETPGQAIEFIVHSRADYLAIGNYIVQRL